MEENNTDVPVQNTQALLEQLTQVTQEQDKHKNTLYFENGFYIGVTVPLSAKKQPKNQVTIRLIDVTTEEQVAPARTITLYHEKTQKQLVEYIGIKPAALALPAHITIPDIIMDLEQIYENALPKKGKYTKTQPNASENSDSNVCESIEIEEEEGNKKNKKLADDEVFLPTNIEYYKSHDAHPEHVIKIIQKDGEDLWVGMNIPDELYILWDYLKTALNRRYLSPALRQMFLEEIWMSCYHSNNYITRCVDAEYIMEKKITLVATKTKIIEISKDSIQIVKNGTYECWFPSTIRNIQDFEMNDEYTAEEHPEYCLVNEHLFWAMFLDKKHQEVYLAAMHLLQMFVKISVAASSFIYIAAGSSGSGKSTTQTSIKQLLYGNRNIGSTLPPTLRDFYSIMLNSRYVIFDDGAKIMATYGQQLCALISGAGIPLRVLYTTSDLAELPCTALIGISLVQLTKSLGQDPGIQMRILIENFGSEIDPRKKIGDMEILEENMKNRNRWWNSLLLFIQKYHAIPKSEIKMPAKGYNRLVEVHKMMLHAEYLGLHCDLHHLSELRNQYVLRTDSIYSALIELLTIQIKNSNQRILRSDRIYTSRQLCYLMYRDPNVAEYLVRTWLIDHRPFLEKDPAILMTIENDPQTGLPMFRFGGVGMNEHIETEEGTTSTQKQEVERYSDTMNHEEPLYSVHNPEKKSEGVAIAVTYE